MTSLVNRRAFIRLTTFPEVTSLLPTPRGLHLAITVLCIFHLRTLDVRQTHERTEKRDKERDRPSLVCRRDDINCYGRPKTYSTSSPLVIQVSSEPPESRVHSQKYSHLPRYYLLLNSTQCGNKYIYMCVCATNDGSKGISYARYGNGRYCIRRW